MNQPSNVVTLDNSRGIVSAEWLSNAITQDEKSLRVFDTTKLRIVDATFFLTDKTRNALQEYQDQHISGAQFFDITTIADTGSPWPNTVPSAEQFQQTVRELGVSDDSLIIAYDRLGLFSAARVWWMFRYFGHDNVAVLDGGLPKWLEHNLPTNSETVDYPDGNFTARPVPELLHVADQVLSIVNAPENNVSIVDARGAGRFAGTSPEPRAGLRAGHIPGSINLPYDTLLNSDHTFKPVEQLEAEFVKAGVDVNHPIVTSCGSGVTACILALALQQIGVDGFSVFDGSWTEWGSTERLPAASLSGNE